MPCQLEEIPVNSRYMKNKDILIVDDDHGNLSLVSQILEMEGMKVVCATCAEDALQHLAKKDFRLMITDRNMPGLDGFALAQKASEIAPQMPIVMITGNLSSDIPRLAEEAGITTVLGKPFRPEEILEAIRAVTGNPRE